MCTGGRWAHWERPWGLFWFFEVHSSPLGHTQMLQRLFFIMHRLVSAMQDRKYGKVDGSLLMLSVVTN